MEIKKQITAGQAESECVESNLLPRPQVLPTMGHHDPEKAPKCGFQSVREEQLQCISIIS